MVWGEFDGNYISFTCGLDVLRERASSRTMIGTVQDGRGIGARKLRSRLVKVRAYYPLKLVGFRRLMRRGILEVLPAFPRC